MTTRESLIEATRTLLWERGYSATSPRAILSLSGAGQGSMYHHFSGKEALALSAIQVNCAELQPQISADLASGETALEGLETYLRRERDVLRGCRFGKLAQDPDVIESDALRTEIAQQFAWMRSHVAQALEQGQEAGEFAATLDPVSVAAAIVGAVQGAYVLAVASADPAAFDTTIDGVIELLRSARVSS